MKTKLHHFRFAVIIAALLFTLNVFSQAPPVTTIGQAICQEGTFTVPVTVTGFNNVADISLTVNYDPLVLSYQGVVVNPLIPVLNTFTTTAPDVTGKFRLSYTGSTGITLADNSVLFTLTFSVLPGVTDVITPLTWGTLQGENDYTPPAPGTFVPEISPATLATYFFGNTVSIKPVPVIQGPVSVCQASPAVSYSTAAGMQAYSWSVSAGGTIMSGAGTNTVSVQWSTPGAQTVSVNYTGLSGCTVTLPVSVPVNVNVVVNPQPAGPTTVCAGTTTNTYTTEPGMTNYIWTVAGGTITAGGTTTSNSATVTWTTPGAQSISVNYTPPAGCTSAPVPLSVTVNPASAPTITGPVSVCNGTGGNIYTTEGGMSGYTWSVSPGGTISGGIGTNSIIVSWNTAGAQTVNINYQNAFGCAAATNVILPVTVNALPVPTITGAVVSCENEQVIYSTEPLMSAYIWSVSPGGTIISGGLTNTVTVEWSTLGQHWVGVNYTNGALCQAASPSQVNINVNTVTIPVVAGPQQVCSGQAGVVYSTQAGMSSYTWNVSPGGSIISGAGTNSVTVMWNTGGPQNVSVNFMNGNGCYAGIPTSYPVTVNALPVPIISGHSAACLNSTGNIYSTIPGMTSYFWEISPGGMITSGANSNAVNVTWISNGNNYLRVIATDQNGCSNVTAVQQDVTVSSNIPLVATTSVSMNPVCTGTVVNYNATVTDDGTTPVFQWKVNGINAGTDNPAFSYTPLQGDIVSCTITTTGSCATNNPVTTAPITMVVQSSFPVSITVTPSTNNICGSAVVNYTTVATNPGPNPVYQWLVNGIASGTNSPSFSYTPANGDNVQCMLTSGYTCASVIPAPSNIVNMIVNPILNVSVSISASVPQVCAGTAVDFTGTAVNGGTGPVYQWQVNGLPVGINSNIYSYVPVNGDIVSCQLTSNVTCPSANPVQSNQLSMIVNVIPSAPVIVQTNDTTLTSSYTSGNEWYFNNVLMPGATGQTCLTTQPGVYYAIVTVNNCVSDTSNHIIVLFTGMDETVNSEGFSVYPSPSDGNFTVDLFSEGNRQAGLYIYNMLSERIFALENIEVNGYRTEHIQLSGIPSGIYTLILTYPDKQFLRKITVNR